MGLHCGIYDVWAKRFLCGPRLYQDRIVTLPKKQRAEQYAAVRRTFEESIQKFGVEGETAHNWLDGTMDMLRALVSEIEAGGGAGGGRA
jgi:hypothetical protein